MTFNIPCTPAQIKIIDIANSSRSQFDDYHAMARLTRAQTAAKALPVVRSRLPSRKIRENNVPAPLLPAKRQKRGSKQHTPTAEIIPDEENEDEVISPPEVDYSFLETTFELSMTAFLDGAPISNRFRGEKLCLFDYKDYR